MNICELKSARVRKGIIQTEISKLLDITTKTYNRKELGLVAFTPNEIEKLSRILELSIYEVNKIFFDSKLTERLNTCKGG